MKYKSSRYNYVLNYKNSSYLYNCAYGSFVQLEREALYKVKQLLSSANIDSESMPEDDSLGRELIRQEFLIPYDRDELGMLKIRHSIGRFDRKDLAYTIAPTLKCNMKCKYCYESVKDYAEDMNEGICDNVVRAIVKEVKERNCKQVSICWFGGEPLLNVASMKIISKRLKDSFSHLGASFKAQLITNGVLLDEALLDILPDLNIRFIQITIDGPPDIHDFRRPLINGMGSFELIINNCKQLISRYKDIFVIINVITDRHNLNVVHQVFEYVDGISGPDERKNIKIAFAPTHCSESNQAKMDFDEFYIDPAEFFKIEINLINECIKRGYSYKPYPRRRWEGCVGNTFGAFIIGPKGELYKCFEEVGMLAKTVGEIIDCEFKTNDRVIPWLSWDPLSDDKCRKCFFLPICMGGCPKNAIFNSSNYGMRCDKNKFILPQTLQTFLETRVHR